MKKIAWLVGAAVIVGGGFYAAFKGSGESTPEIEYRYEEVQKGELVRSISATGLIVALTSVDVKCKAGGNVVKLVVDEGSIVKKGDLIAVVDPADTQSVYDQAQADLNSAIARASQAEENLKIQAQTAKNDVADAELAVKLAQVRLERAQIDNRRQPEVSNSAVDTAKANYDAAVASLRRLEDVQAPQQRLEASGAVDQARANRDTAAANLDRQKQLFEKGFVALGTVQAAEAQLAAAKTAFDNAVQRQATLDKDIAAQLRDAKLAVDRTQAGVQQAKANLAQNDLARVSVAEARRSLEQARVALERAKANQRLVEVRRKDIVAAQAATVRNRVALDNAKVQLDSTTVLAPRDGVVTKKYIEEGTIIPPGLSTFAEGTSIVQLSDVTQLFVECAVDEADIGAVKTGQKVRITTEAFPGESFNGVVERVNPSAVTEQNVTAVKVRVRVEDGKRPAIVPGMNATCEFITLQKAGVLLVASQAVQNEDGKSFVEVKSSDPLKPERREVKIGQVGNDGTEILEGIKEGDEIVIAKIDLAQEREIQKKMMEAQEGGGLAGGGSRPGQRPRARAQSR
jgi:HlyD family secretion protein